MEELKKKLENLKKFFEGKKVIVAYSGGVDSSLVAKIASDTTETLAITIDNGFFSEDAIKKAEIRAKKYGIRHKVIKLENVKMHELEEPITQLKKNPTNRCYLCKKIMAIILINEKEKLGYDLIVDGTIYDDLFEDRPGIQAFREHGIKSPLAEFKISKKDVYELSNYLGMEIPKKETCLATRIRFNQEITEEKLKRVEMAEKFLSKYIKGTLRVRDDGGIARIEVNKDEIKKFFNEEFTKMVVDELKKLGFERVSLDLEGYKRPLKIKNK
ncbi:ATP-dependent sacrificial sulfur transferase LarE [Methanotorris igneus]|uniref:Uncharacterized protein n=1 Tax=Methanotorris igneus (strain DSM 5666 / JCM 11834 / Kol 5) TaxID=880724 RepID=F6BCQ1_METIK|nr:ATP-dependent sacrificial sulfur transferase LarE [Methanotorris igneus]AEF96262.1 Conserved hypothetical protein CHP00268 [Methanotorris igneus Kol 5]